MVTKKSSETPIEIETLKYQIKNEEKINELIKKVETLSTANPPTTLVSPDTNSGQIIVPISGKFLAQVMPTLEFSLTENR